MIRSKISFLFAILLLLSTANIATAQNLGVHPTTLSFNLTSGQSETQVVNLSNGSKKKVQFRLYLNDWVRDSTGAHEYYEPNTLSRSCSRWVTLSQNFVEVEPGQTASINVKLQLPDSASAIDEMKWSMLFIETVEEQDNSADKGAQATVKNLLRIGVHIYQTPPNLTEKKVKVYSLDEVPGDQPNAPAIYRISCQNTGQIMLDCKAYIELSSLADGNKTKLDPVEFPMFPDQRRYVYFQLPANLAKGKYSALGVLDAGEDLSLQAVEKTIEVK